MQPRSNRPSRRRLRSHCRLVADHRRRCRQDRLLPSMIRPVPSRASASVAGGAVQRWSRVVPPARSDQRGRFVNVQHAPNDWLPPEHSRLRPLTAGEW